MPGDTPRVLFHDPGAVMIVCPCSGSPEFPLLALTEGEERPCWDCGRLWRYADVVPLAAASQVTAAEQP